MRLKVSSLIIPEDEVGVLGGPLRNRHWRSGKSPEVGRPAATGLICYVRPCVYRLGPAGQRAGVWTTLRYSDSPIEPSQPTDP